MCLPVREWTGWSAPWVAANGWKGGSMRIASWAAVLLTVIGICVYGQVNTGTILGKVTDPSGAVVTNAEVTVANSDTGVKLSGRTNEVGDFAFRTLLPGRYTLTVAQPGFRNYELTGIPVAVAQTTTHNVSLTIGEPASSVTVEAELAGVGQLRLRSVR